jgi:hypothetical protein
MSYNRALELMHGEIDGANDSSESRELEALLTAHPELRDEFEALKELGRAFEASAEVDPPDELRRRILDSTIAAPSKAGGFIAALRGFFDMRWNLRVAYVTAAFLVIVVALGLLLPQLGSKGDLQGTDRLFGTFGLEAELVPTDTLPLSHPQVQGRILARYYDEEIRVELEFDAESELQVEFNSLGDLRYDGSRSSHGRAHRIEVGAGQTVLHHRGEEYYIFVFKHDPASPCALEMRLYVDNELLVNREFSSPAE